MNKFNRELQDCQKRFKNTISPDRQNASWFFSNTLLDSIIDSPDNYQKHKSHPLPKTKSLLIRLESILSKAEQAKLSLENALCQQMLDETLKNDFRKQQIKSIEQKCIEQVLNELQDFNKQTEITYYTKLSAEISHATQETSERTESDSKNICNTVEAIGKKLETKIEELGNKTSPFVLSPNSRTADENFRVMMSRAQGNTPAEKYLTIARDAVTRTEKGEAGGGSHYLTPRMVHALNQKLKTKGANRKEIINEYAEAVRKRWKRLKSTATKH